MASSARSQTLTTTDKCEWQAMQAGKTEASTKASKEICHFCHLIQRWRIIIYTLLIEQIFHAQQSLMMHFHTKRTLDIDDVISKYFHIIYDETRAIIARTFCTFVSLSHATKGMICLKAAIGKMAVFEWDALRYCHHHRRRLCTLPYTFCYLCKYLLIWLFKVSLFLI